MSKKTLSQKLYLFAAKRNWTWLVKLLLWAGFIQGDQLFVTTDKPNQHSALYYALSHRNKALAEQLIKNAPNLYWHELSQMATDTMLNDFLSLAIDHEFKEFFEKISVNADLGLQVKISKALSKQSINDASNKNTLFDDAIRNTADDDDLELIRCLSNIISHVSPSLVADTEQTEGQNPFARACYTATKHDKEPIVTFFLKEGFVSQQDVCDCRLKQCLKQRGYDTQIVIPEFTALEIAVEKSDEATLTELFHQGAQQTGYLTLIIALQANPINPNILNHLLMEKKFHITQKKGDAQSPEYVTFISLLEQTYSQAIEANNTALLKVLEGTAGMSSPLDAPTQAPSPDAHFIPAKPAMTPPAPTMHTTDAAAQQERLRPIQ